MSKPRKITMQNGNYTLEEGIAKFYESRKAKGVTDKTLDSYRNNFRAVSKYIAFETCLDDITTEDINAMIVVLRDKELSSNTIASYIRALRALFKYLESENIVKLHISAYKTEETVKDTYTDEELKKLLKKPNLKQCDFVEYRSWVIVNLLLNCGLRAATIRTILIKDVNLENRTILYRHNKNHKVQFAPLCNEMAIILREYLKFRKGNDNDVLFPNEYDEPLTEGALAHSIAKYNTRRGVAKTSIHLFRHSFAERFIQNGGNPFELQKILGHSTLEMTKHYCRLYDYSIVNTYDTYSPLASMVSKREKISMSK